MNLEDITPLILTRNEEPNISRTLERLRWARRVIVLDSQSTDATRDIARAHSNVTWLERPFDDHTSQWNHGLDAVETEWVLSLDADYVLPENFADELRALEPGKGVDAFFARFSYCVFGKALRAALYPPRAVLFRKVRCRYENDGHTQRLVVNGRTEFLRGVIEHDDRKPLSRWFASQDQYAVLEAEKLLGAKRAALKFQDRLRLWIVPAPVLTFFYCLIARGLIFDGWRGWFYTWQRTVAEIMLSLRLLEKKLAAE